MIFDRFTQNVRSKGSLIKFADRFFGKRSTSFSVGPPQTVYASFVCALSVLYIVFSLIYSRRIFASSAITEGHYPSMWRCMHAHNLAHVCWWLDCDLQLNEENEAEISTWAFPSEAHVTRSVHSSTRSFHHKWNG